MNINTPKEAIPKKSKKKSAVVIIVLIILCAGGYFYFSAPKTKKEVIKSEEIIIEKPRIEVSWEFPDITMDVGETREIKWVSSQKIYPNIYHAKKIINITGFIESGIIISAIKSGTEEVILRIGEEEVTCVVRVNEAGK